MSALHSNLMMLLPELILAGGGMLTLMFGVLRGEKGMGASSLVAMIVLAAAAYFVGVGGAGTAFNGAFVVDDFGRFAKMLALLGAAIALIMAQGYFENEKLARFEFPV